MQSLNIQFLNMLQAIMGLFSVTLIFSLVVLSSCSLILAQQSYQRKAANNCSNNASASSVLGYSLNGVNPSCQAYLVFRSKPPHNTVSSISALFGSHPFDVSVINSVSVGAEFGTDQLVTVPLNCSSSGEYYQANISYVVDQESSFPMVANDTFQGLSTCQAMQNQNSNITQNLHTGVRIVVPLRCACPTKKQIDEGVEYLLSYPVTWTDTVRRISAVFGVDTEMTLEANGLSEQDYVIYPFTTILVPLQNVPSNQFFALPSAPPPPSSLMPPIEKQPKKSRIYIVFGVLTGGGLGFLFGITMFIKFCKSKAITIFEGLEEKMDEEKILKFLKGIDGIAQSLKVYSFEELQSATDNFNPSFWMKGSAYRGIIDGDIAVIKKMNGDVTKEINLLNKINHSNLISLLGVCFDDDHWYLVYEYAVNGSLSDWIYNNGKFLNWTQRIHIALDIATGLSYLHSYTYPPHVHKNINSSNILLDSVFKAKITNFASAKSAEGEEGEFSLTRHIIGTKGYMAPEYIEIGLVSTKLDVYAFGVLLQEIITGKDAREESSHLQYASNEQLHEEDERKGLRRFIDPSMQGSYPIELDVSVVKLIHSCLHKDPSSRPAMDDIVQSLSKILQNTLNCEHSASVSG